METADARELVYPISVDLYHQICELDPGLEKSELIEGVILRKTVKSSEHSYYSGLIAAELSRILPERCILRIEKPLTLQNSEPEPDICVVSGSLSDYRDKNPTTAILVVEISKTSLESDRRKARIYAKANVENYWILNLQTVELEVHSQPAGDSYKERKVFTRKDRLPIFGSELDLSILA